MSKFGKIIARAGTGALLGYEVNDILKEPQTIEIKYPPAPQPTPQVEHSTEIKELFFVFIGLIILVIMLIFGRFVYGSNRKTPPRATESL